MSARKVRRLVDARRLAAGRAPPSADPRHIVVMTTLIALAAVTALLLGLLNVVHQSQAAVGYARTSVAVPLRRLHEVIDANAAGEGFLQVAAASTGADRNAALSSSITSAEVAAKAWTSYRAVALPLTGEQGLATVYERDRESVKAISGDVMVPIVRSDQAEALPLVQLRAVEQNRLDLVAMEDLYAREGDTALRSLHERLDLASERLMIGAAVAFVAVLLCGFLALRLARRVVAERRLRASAADLADFESRLIRGLELVDDDSTAFRIAGKAAAEADSEVAVSVIALDGDRARFLPVVGGSPCQVEDPAQCPAIRAGSPLQFHDSRSLDSCPVLAARGAACSVACMPVSVAGRNVAVMQLTGPAGAAPDMGAAVRLVVRRVGERITLLRAFARFELEASRDPLTGLYNRRSLTAAIEQLDDAGTPYTVAFADLDHFKQLNDIHGHDAGDRALRSFARTLRSSLRPEDLCSRWGGEEFVVILPTCSEARAVDAMDRVRVALAADRGSGLETQVKVSVGVAEGRAGEVFGEVLARADEALREAKTAGRDRVLASRKRAPGGSVVELAMEVAKRRGA
jgi:diguanylate cyclase (GGDEF)-like protein